MPKVCERPLKVRPPRVASDSAARRRSRRGGLRERRKSGASAAEVVRFAGSRKQGGHGWQVAFAPRRRPANAVVKNNIRKKYNSPMPMRKGDSWRVERSGLTARTGKRDLASEDPGRRSGREEAPRPQMAPPESRFRFGRPHAAISPFIGATPSVSGNTERARTSLERPRWSASTPFSTARRSVVGLRSRAS